MRTYDGIDCGMSASVIFHFPYLGKETSNSMIFSQFIDKLQYLLNFHHKRLS